MGQAGSISSPRSSNASCGVTTSAGVAPPNNLPPLTFHQSRGENVRISRDGTTARRVESFCKGVAFGARPVRINEKVCIRFSEISNNWSGVLRFGFTSNDPSTVSHALPKYACPDLTNKPGYWAKALAERFCEKDNILHYYVNSTGDVHFGINGEEKGLFFSGVETRGPLWVLLDVYGNCTAVQFVDSRVSNPACRRSAMQERRTMSPELEDRLSGGLRNMSIEEPIIPLRYNTGTLAPVPLHRMKGRNVRIVPEQGIATRVDTEFAQGYVFTARPLQLGETIVIQILSTEPLYVGSLALGLTSCDPNGLSPMELPEDADLLLDRPEYWVVSKDAAGSPRRGDELSFCVTADGEVKVAKNGGAAVTVMHVDHSLRLWAFVDVYGATQKVRILGRPAQQVPTVHHNAPVRSASSVGVRVTPAADGGALLVVNLPPAQNFANHQSQSAASAYLEQPIPGSSTYCSPGPISPPVHHQMQPSSSSSQWINHQSSSSSNNVNIPMCQQAVSSQNNLNGQQMAHNSTQLPTIANVQIPISSSQLNSLAQTQMNHSNGQMLVNVQNEVSSSRQGSSGVQNQMSAQIAYDSNASCSRMSTHEIYGALGETVTINGPTTLGECTICYENPIDSVLYMCGHMCMCYRCAVQQWRGKGGGQCPLCRAYIRDVIRTYKS